MMVSIKPRWGPVPARAFWGNPRRRAGVRAGMGLTPGYTPAQQAMADAFAAQFGAAPAVYQAPAVIPTPACVQDTQPGGAAFSDACQAELQRVQQANLAAHTGANYTVDLSNCNSNWAENDARYASFGLPRPPNTCNEDTFGLTLPGTTGGTNALIPDAAALLGPAAAANAAAAAANIVASGGTPAASAPASVPQSSTPAAGGSLSSGAGGSASGSSSILPWALGAAAVLALVFAVANR